MLGVSLITLCSWFYLRISEALCFLGFSKIIFRAGVTFSFKNIPSPQGTCTECTLGEFCWRLCLLLEAGGVWPVSVVFFSGWVCKWRPAGSREMPLLPQGAHGRVWEPPALAHCGKGGNGATGQECLFWICPLGCTAAFLSVLLFPCSNQWTEADSKEIKI